MCRKEAQTWSQRQGQVAQGEESQGRNTGRQGSTRREGKNAERSFGSQEGASCLMTTTRLRYSFRLK